MARATPFIHDLPAAEALAAWTDACAAAGCPVRLETVRLGLDRAMGRVLAEPVWARRSSPPFDAAAMDGIAVRAADTVGASETVPKSLAAELFEVVDTGDPVPPGYDAVIMREHVHDGAGGSVELHAAAAPYQHVRSIGEDVSATELLLPAGHRLRPVDLGAAGAAGVPEVTVRRRPLVAVIPTGDEIRPIDAELEPGELPDTNSLMLCAQAEQAGCEARRGEAVGDDPAALAAALREAAEGSDLVILIAGSSAGRDDYTAEVVADAGTLAVHGVAVKPGHPVVLGAAHGTPVIGAPGYPVSAALTFDIFARPFLAALEGAPPPDWPVARARLARKLASTMGMDDWIRVRLGRVGDGLVATPLPRGAGVLTSLVRADALLVVPAALEGRHAGDDVEVRLLRGVGEIERTMVVTGSHDLILDLAASALRERDPRVTLASSNVGSLGGLTALRDGLCHVAGSHLLDPASGDHTLPYVERLLPDHDVAVVRLAHREQGLLVAPGNPLGLSGIDDLVRDGLRYVNRQRGAGTRVLLDHELAKRSIEPGVIDGYEREEHTHLAVAAAVAAGARTAALACSQPPAPSSSTSRRWPVSRTTWCSSATHSSPSCLPRSGCCLRSSEFRAAVESLGGYGTAEMGERIR